MVRGQFLPFVLLLSGCQVAGEPATPPGAVSVDLVFSDLGVAIDRVYPVEEFPLTHFQAPAALRYQLLDGDGDPVVAGVLPDTRWAYSEGVENGVPYREDVRFAQGYVSVRLPSVRGTLILSEPRQDGAVELGRVDFDPGVGRSRHALAGDDDILADPVTLHGGDAAKVKLLIVPEGYTEEQMPLFEMRAAEMTHDLFATRDYSDYRGAFRVQRQNVRSQDSGLEGKTGDTIDSAFELQTSTSCPEFGGPRSWWGLGGSKGEDLVRDLGKRAGAHYTIVLVNYEEPLTACARDQLVVLGAGDNPGRILAHELGHALFDLGDEYVSGRGTFPPLCSVSGWFGAGEKANVTTDGGSPPWWDLVTEGVPLPTPNSPDYGGVVGAFEGAQGCDNGYFRPSYHCMMDNSNAFDFCPVCRREMDRFFWGLGVDAIPDDPECPKKWRGDGICDPCLGNDIDCGGLRCDTDGTCDLTVGERCGNCPEDCGECAMRGCGDGQCADDETDTCEEDCGCRADYCMAEVAPFGCWCDAACEGRGDCCFDAGICNR